MVSNDIKMATPINSKYSNVKTIDIREDSDITAGYHLHREKLGEGGFSKVRLATHLLTGEKVAVKCMDKSKLGEDLFRVETEISALKTLHHEHIAKLLQVIETHDKIFLILEYCSGGELFDYIVARSRLTEDESKHIIGCLCRCLAYLHANGFAHRDLKPENILFDKTHRIKLIDFGLAAQSKNTVASLQHLRTCCGSPAYAAPELLAGSEYSGPAVDVWSTGVILYALLVGQLPFDDDNMSVLYKKIKNCQYTLPSWLSEESKSIIQSMLQVDPRKRITIKGLLDTQWIRTGLKADPLVCHKNLFDDEILWQVHKFYPNTSYVDLRYSILKKFGYQTATYWLMKERKNSIKFIPPTIKTSTPKESETKDKKVSTDGSKVSDNDTPRQVAVKRKFDENTPAGTRRSVAPNTVEKKTDSSRQGTFIVPPRDYAKMNGIGNNNNSTPTKQNVRNERDAFSPTRLPTINNPLSPTRLTVTNYPLSPNRVPINAKNILSPTKIPVADPNFFTPVKKRRVTDDIDEKTPILGSESSKFETPKTNNIYPQTPKRSLFKKILASATPVRANKPRNITQSAHTTTKNITMTKFEDPQLCIEKLINALSCKGIECKQKGFMIRCAMNSNTKNSLTFTLEICKFGQSCAIQRKRLRGDAWCYKRICEEILRISNEIQCQ